VTLPGCLIFRGCARNPSIDRAISPDEIIGEWYLDNSEIEAARRNMRNVPGYVIKDNGKDNKIVLNKDGTCIISLVNLGSYDDPEYFETKGKWSLTNIPYKKGSTRANNMIPLPWKPQFAHNGMRVNILEEEGGLVL
jgi:hypothetical protein